MSYDHRVVVDFDDTISFTLNRDWEHAAPNLPLINKLNSLYDQGWEVYIVTARGQLSCNGDSDAADKKYRPQVEAWLAQHSVRYTRLSFQKFLAAYYIDDKMLSPEGFVDLRIETLREGRSGAVVERRDDRVMKTGKRVSGEALWYKVAADYIPQLLPPIYSFIGQTLTMGYVENSPPRRIGAREVRALAEVIRPWAKIRDPRFGVASVLTMTKRIAEHLTAHPEVYLEAAVNLTALETHFARAFLGAGGFWELNASFSHGDFSLDNVLWGDRGNITLIDPIFDEGLYSSYLFDIGKLLHSLHRHRHDDAYALATDLFRLDAGSQARMDAIELAQWVRIVKYTEGAEQARIVQFIAEVQRRGYETHAVEYR